nr:sal-like protein 4 [Nerophis lumbriciformis]
MSRRKQKRPQHLVNADPGGPGVLAHDEHMGMKSPSTSLGSEVTSSGSSASSPTSLQDCQPPLAPRPSPGGLHAPSLPNESSPPPHWPNHIAPFATSLPNTHSSLSPDFPHPSLSSQTHSPPPLGKTSGPQMLTHQGNSHSTMTSPMMGSSATTTTSSSSSLCVPTHCDSDSLGQLQASSLPGHQLQVPPTLAVLLEELRVLQQRQIHQMQITEEICRHVLRLGGAVFGQDANTQASGTENNQKPSGGASSPPAHLSTATTVTTAPSLLTGISSSLFSQLPLSKQGASQVNGSRTPMSSTSPASSIATMPSSSVASLHPLSLSLGLPLRYLHEKSANTSLFARTNGISFTTPPVPTTSHSQDLALPASSLGSALGRPQHVCRFCGKVLSSDSSLQIHLRSHTGERPYQCPVCLSRFTTRGNLKAHFLRHREQNPELSLSLLPPALSEQTQSSSASGTIQRRRKRRADDDESFNGVKGSIPGVTDNMALGFLSGTSSRPSASSLPLPPTVDMALLSTAHSLLQLNRASVAASAPSSVLPSSSSSMGSQYKGAKQQRFDENTPPHSALHAATSYSQLAQLPKILFPGGTSPHHLALLRPSGHPSSPHLTSPHQLPFPFPPFPKPSTTSPSSSPATSTQTSDTSKLQRLVQKLEKQPQGGASSSSSAQSSSNSSLTFLEAKGDTNGHDHSTNSSAYRREMLAALGLSPNTGGLASGQGVSGSNSTTTTATSSLPTAQAANQCGVCLRVLSCPRALRLHQATHLGERPFPCKLCGRSFSTKGSLRAHLATHRARPPNSRAQNSCPLCPRKFTNALVLQHHIRLHLGGQIPPDEDMPVEDSTETGKAIFDDTKNDSPSTVGQHLPLALTKSSASKTAPDVKTEESGSSTPSISPPPTYNPHSAGAEDSLVLKDNNLVGGGPLNGSTFPQEEAPQADLGSPLKAPLTSLHPAVVNEEDTPLALCVSKHDVQTHDADSPAPKINPIPALISTASPGAVCDAQEANGNVQHSPGVQDVIQIQKEENNTSTADPVKETSEIPEPLAAALGPHSQHPRPDKPYSCSQCGKAYASRSGLKGHMKTHPNAYAKPQTNESNFAEDPSSKILEEKQEGKEGSSDPEASTGCDKAGELLDATT